MKQATLTDKKLDALQEVTCAYYLHETNPANGLVADKTQRGSPAGIAAVGLALSAYPGWSNMGVSRVWKPRGVRSRLCGFFGTARRDRNRTPQATRGSTTTSSTCRPDEAPVNANCPLLKRRCCCQASSPLESTSIRIRRKGGRYGDWPRLFTAVLTGAGPRAKRAP
jgi:hypothetical protein